MLRLFLMVFALSLPAVAKQITLRIPLDSEHIAVVTFDDARISATDVQHSLGVEEYGVYATTVLGYVGDCNANDIPKMQKDIEKAQQIVDELNPSEFPPELSGVVMYLNDLQSFWLWQAEQELEFLKRGRSPDVEYKGTEFPHCQVHLETLNKSQACHQVVFNWNNCVLHTMEKQLGGYPKDQWKAFLDAYGIQERVEGTIGD
jgi:hypothetical protein